jgi:hypothetical protein
MSQEGWSHIVYRRMVNIEGHLNERNTKIESTISKKFWVCPEFTIYNLQLRFLSFGETCYMKSVRLKWGRSSRWSPFSSFRSSWAF